jgi:N-methylhydantoinase A
MSYIIGTDIGGTFTDCVIMDKEGHLNIGKALSTPGDFSKGCTDSIEATTSANNLDLDEVIRKASIFALGTTIAENAIITRGGARTGLLTTKGFEDTILMMRGGLGRVTGLTEFEISHVTHTRKPVPIVPRSLIEGITERTDSQGKVLVPLNNDSVVHAIKTLNSKNVDSLAVCLLWSFKNNSHELEIKRTIEQIAKDKFVTVSSEFVPIMGEYERMSTTVLNAYVGPVVSQSIESLASKLVSKGFHGHFFVMYSHGGLLPSKAASSNAVGLVEGGPVAGLVGTIQLGQLVQEPNIVAADMGGTTFKVGIIKEGEAIRAREPSIAQYPIASPRLDIVSIGAGGGSIAWIEPYTGLLKVGPRSAGAKPGPISYELGGTEPTVTDADLICGYLNPDYFLGGRMKLNKALAEKGVEKHIASKLGVSVVKAADGIRKIAEAQAADLIRKVTIERGFDPREFTMFAYGGAGAIHADDIARELSVKKIVVPATASVHCALGLITSDVVHEYVLSDPLSAPADPKRFARNLQQLEEKALRELSEDGFSRKENNIDLRFGVDVRYRRQVHEVTTPISFDGSSVTEESLESVVDTFEKLYEGQYGKGSGYRPAGIEFVTFRLTAIGNMKKPVIAREQVTNAQNTEDALKGKREVYFGSEEVEIAKIYEFGKLKAGAIISGPAIIETPVTSIPIKLGHQGEMDVYRNVHITWS